MFYDIALIAALCIFGAGLAYKIFSWFRLGLGIHTKKAPLSARAAAAFKGLAAVIFSKKLLTLLRVFATDVLLQLRILKEDFMRWLMHMLIFWGFMLLLLMHALDSFITARLFSDYAATLNPFMFLRDAFGFMVILGLVLAVIRRFILKVPRLKTGAMDHYAILILAVIMLSGIFLEGAKITSYTRYQEMVEQYGNLDDEDELKALETYWVKAYGLVSPNIQEPEDDLLERGQELNDESCLSCHARPVWAFTGYLVSRAIRPAAVSLDEAGLPRLLWFIHILACLGGLAYLPFSKMFHILATPFSLMANAVMHPETSDPLNIATRQAMELDACTRCDTCSLRCSVAVASDSLENPYILPSERMRFLSKYIKNKEIGPRGLQAIQQGIYLCSNCDRCTVSCPAGINLKDLWFGVREELIQSESPVPLMLTPFSFYRGLRRPELDPEVYDSPLGRAQIAVAENYPRADQTDAVIPLKPPAVEGDKPTGLPDGSGTYAYCFACENCSTVCPVVGNYEDPQKTLKLLPHQVMRSLGLGLKDLALGSRMLWDCLTCYQCQEHCPQGVKVTDVLFELKNTAVKERDRFAVEKAS